MTVAAAAFKQRAERKVRAAIARMGLTRARAFQTEIRKLHALGAEGQQRARELALKACQPEGLTSLEAAAVVAWAVS